jgi:hypothetical protein
MSNWRTILMGTVASLLLVLGLVVFGNKGCESNQVIANKCHCEGDLDTGKKDTEIDLDFTKKTTPLTPESVCTVWVLMEHMSKTRVWIDTRVRCNR